MNKVIYKMARGKPSEVWDFKPYVRNPTFFSKPYYIFSCFSEANPIPCCDISGTVE